MPTPNGKRTEEHRDQLGRFEEGNPGGGRPKGSVSFKTKWEKFITKIAEKNELLPEDIDEQLLAVAYKKAKAGDYQFYRDIHDRVHGKPQQDIELGGEVKVQITGINMVQPDEGKTKQV